jgi:hypothetical protein
LIRLLPLFLLGCGSAGNGAKGGDSSADPVDTWASILADKVSGGMFLSSWHDGTALVLVGGNLGDDTGVVGRYDGDSLCSEPDVTDGVLWWIDGDDSGWYAVGTHGVILHDQGGTRTREDVPTDATLFGVWVDGDTVWAVGGDIASQEGEIWRKEGGTWTLFQSALPGLLFKIWEGWIVGDSQAWFWDGAELLDRAPPGNVRLLTAYGTSIDDVWAVGGLAGPVLLHWSDGAWSAPVLDTHCAQYPLSGVHVIGDKVWIAGHSGTASLLENDEWTCDFPPITREHFHGVFPFGDEMIWLGGNLLSGADSYGTVAVYPKRSPLSETPTCP